MAQGWSVSLEPAILRASGVGSLDEWRRTSTGLHALIWLRVRRRSEGARRPPYAIWVRGSLAAARHAEPSRKGRNGDGVEVEEMKKNDDHNRYYGVNHGRKGIAPAETARKRTPQP